MRLHCALCGRPMDAAAVFIAQYPVGPTCARRAGLLELVRKSGSLVHAGRRAAVRQPRPQNLDLFEVPA